jgi:hypothetical protein
MKGAASRRWRRTSLPSLIAIPVSEDWSLVDDQRGPVGIFVGPLLSENIQTRVFRKISV